MDVSNNHKKEESDSFDDHIDFKAIFNELWQKKLLVILITVFFTLAAILYVLFATPIYKATAMIQVEEKAPNMPGFDDVVGIFEDSSKSSTEIELLKSRRVIGEAVESLDLDLIVEPVLFPFIGEKLFRSHNSELDGEIAPAKFGAPRYSWGGERIDVHRFEIPPFLLSKRFILTVESDQNFTLTEGKNILLKGTVGEELQGNGVSLMVKSLSARPGTEFYLMRVNKFSATADLQEKIIAAEKGKDTGIIVISINDKDPILAKDILDKVAEIYVQQNVLRSSAEAQKSLDFLKFQLPEVKKQLEIAEQKFNNYQIRQQSINISLETQGVLAQIIELETKLQEMELSRLELSLRFKEEHPLYQSVLEQIRLVEEQKNNLSDRIANLPETQQELLRYTRDVEVSSEIYMMLLSKVQELDIIRAGSVGNVRVIDHADVNLYQPIKPRKVFVVMLSSVFGMFISFIIIWFQRLLFSGLEDPGVLEEMGILVYATIPQSKNISNNQKKLEKGKRTKKNLLAIDFPNDLSVEALRTLRTSLHFAMRDSKNNVIAISGPSPGIGKSFVSANLGAVIAQGEQKVLIIDGDLRRGDLQDHLGLNFDSGLTGYLSGQYSIDEVIKGTSIKCLDILPRGVVANNPSELLMNARFSELIKYVAENYDIVIIDTPPLLAVTDPAIISAHAGTTLLVARFGITQKREVEVTKKRFEQNGVIIRGVVFNGLKSKGSKSYSHYGYYNYNYQ